MKDKQLMKKIKYYDCKEETKYLVSWGHFVI